MAENNVLFRTLLALISSFIACVEINFAFMRTTISHFKRILNLIQFVESLSSRRRRAKCHRSEPHQVKAIWVRPARTRAWWVNVQAGLAIVLDKATVTLKNAAKSNRRQGLRMPAR